MEKFAVDLDKVLDDFELDEDENESINHYDKLQLEFQNENVVLDADTGSVGAVAGLRAAIPDVSYQLLGRANNILLPTSRSDSSHPNQLNVAGDVGLSNANAQDTLPTDEQLEPHYPTNSHLSHENVPDVHENHSLRQFPDLPCSMEYDLDPPKNESESHDSRPNNVSIEGNLSASAFCSLDVIPFSTSSNASCLNEDIQQPDILDMKQHSSEENLMEGNNIPESNLNEGAIGGPPREPLLLPDIMSTNNISEVGDSHYGQQSDLPNPAIITENSLGSFHPNEPAIVQESQSMHRIPEVVNIHQSAEQLPPSWLENSTNRENNMEQDERCIPETIEPFRISPNRCLPDVSAACDIVGNTVGAVVNPSTSAVKFDPNSDVPNDDDLDAELQELEEEQARLQGAYGNNRVLFDDLIGNSKMEEHNEEPKEPDVSNSCNVSLSPDIIGNIEVNNESASSSQELKEEDNNVIEASAEEDGEAVVSASCVDLTAEETSAVEVDKRDVVTEEGEASVKDTETTDDLSSESTGTDTTSSSTSSTLTEQEVLTPAASISDPVVVPVSTDSLEESPSRDTPGSLVTAVYGESNRDMGAQGGAEPAESPGVGQVAPFWIPDDEAPNCQECSAKFTVIRRRHHCRGCGRVLCSPCCHFKAPLPYMDFKEARVCNTCLQIISLASEKEENDFEAQRGQGKAPNPNNPMEYCSRIPPQQQVGAQGNSQCPTVMVPVGVLKRENSATATSASRSTKQVIFSDGIRPGGDLTEQGGQVRPSSPFRKIGRATKRINQKVPGEPKGRNSCSGRRGNGSTTLVPDPCLVPTGTGLPPVLLHVTSDGEYVFETSNDVEQLEEKMRSDGPPVVFALQKNLTVLVKLVKLDCCVGLEVWNVATRGLCNVGQEELVVLLEVAPGEKSPPPHLFAFFHTVYQQANKGNLVTELGHSIFTEPEGFLGSKDHGGFLYIRPTFQCLHKLVLPPAPYIFAVLIQKWETPWAKVFPLRLMLRLGAEFRYYPCPLVSNRNRKPVYCEIGHTIMNLLVDFRNYAYTVAVVQGFVIHMEDKRTTLIFPRNRYEQVCKVLNNSNDHVLALGSNFSPQADSHLVTVEDDDGHYSTQAINIHNKPRKVTGASFIVFNGALKSNSGLKAKSSIVEDGLMVQIPGEMMTNFRESLRNMKDFDIPCGPSGASEPDELVTVRWGPEDKNFNIGIRSPIDNRQMDGVPSVKIHSGTDYISNELLIRWTEVFIIKGEASTGNSDINISRLAECLARACCVALTPHLELLYGTGPNRLGLRASIHQEDVGYECGMAGSRLLPTCMNELDTELIPVIHRAAANITDEPIVLELLFHIMQQ